MAASPRKNGFRVTCIQINAGSDYRKNLDSIQKYIKQALRFKPSLIALPENFLWRGPAVDFPEIAARFQETIRSFQRLADEYHVGFLLGSLLEPSRVTGKFFNTSVCISDRGRVLAHYRKMHLFDIDLKEVSAQESKHILPGKKIISARFGSVRLGFSICYDLRFPELYRELSRAGSKVIFVPANFTYPTGKAHWELLLRARAIENQAFVAAPAQVGIHPATEIKSFGTSLIIDPWGKILARGDEVREDVISASLDLGYLERLRKYFPVLEHRRIG